MINITQTKGQPHYGPGNPHPLSQVKTELIWEDKYDEHGNRREVDVAGCVLPLQMVESIDELRQRAEAQGELKLWQRNTNAVREQAGEYTTWRNRLIWGDNKLVMASLLADFNGKIDPIYIVAAGGTVYLTNIHRLYDPTNRRGNRENEMQPWAGPEVSKAKALDTGEILRERITSHKRLMVLNDGAHHLWDPDSAWNEAVDFLNEQTRKRNEVGLVAQLDFSATPKDNHGNLFKHIVIDTPLGEAVDGGIVKTPIIGRGQKLIEQTSDNAGVRYQNHILLGYKRWLESKKEWDKSGKKALLFVMCEDTTDADNIAKELNSNPLYEELNGRTVNLHTNLKGKVVWKGHGAGRYAVFKESEKEISDEDLKALRELSRQLDENTSPYLCIVSVLMLREGWDVQNVTTIVPLRPYSSKANILPEQTLGRGLRRMMQPGQANEAATVVEHPAFTSLYKEQLAQEGLFVDETDVEDIRPTTVTIYPDELKANFKSLDLLIPRLTPAHRIVPVLDNLALKDVEDAFARYKKLPLGSATAQEIDYEGRQRVKSVFSCKIG
ncbi:MAG: hypothetical protein QME66_13050 [Candidatus Eisenbacteria bacterium]|nr:hypothetical protein [Candidatus Eisenbacteria bacterium]